MKSSIWLFFFVMLITGTAAFSSTYDEYAAQVSRRAQTLTEGSNALIQLENLKTILKGLPTAVRCRPPSTPASTMSKAISQYRLIAYSALVDCRSSLRVEAQIIDAAIIRATSSLSVAKNSAALSSEQLRKALEITSDANSILSKLKKRFEVADALVRYEMNRYQNGCPLSSKDVDLESDYLAKARAALSADDPYLVRQAVNQAALGVSRAKSIAAACPTPDTEAIEQKIDSIFDLLTKAVGEKTVETMFENSCRRLKAAEVQGYWALCGSPRISVEAEGAMHAQLVLNAASLH